MRNARVRCTFSGHRPDDPVKDRSAPLTPPGTLQRFLDAQESTYADALAEVQGGRKRSHWMWFICPQLAGLGRSAMARHYAIADLAEARAYLAHPVLGARLREVMTALLAAPGRSALDLLGSPDDLKLHSCATLFALVSESESVFHLVLGRFFDGAHDDATLRLLGFGRLDG